MICRVSDSGLFPVSGLWEFNRTEGNGLARPAHAAALQGERIPLGEKLLSHAEQGGSWTSTLVFRVFAYDLHHYGRISEENEWQVNARWLISALYSDESTSDRE